MTLIPGSEIIQVPSDWKVIRLDHLFEIRQGKQVSKKNREGHNQRPFLRTRNVFWGRTDLSDLDHMNFSEHEERSLGLYEGDLLVCEGGDIGRTAIWRNQVPYCYFQNHLHRLRARDSKSIDPNYALFWLWYAFKVGNVYFGRGNITTIPNLSSSRLGELPIATPSLLEQQKIAHVLSTVQRAMEQQDRIIALTTELKKALMHKLFTQGLRDEPRKETEIGPVPESWRLVNLGDVARLFGGYAFKSRDTVASSDTQLIRMGNLHQNKLELSRGPIFYPNDFARTYHRFVLYPGDLVISLTGTMGKEDYGFTVKIVDTDKKTLLLNQRVARIDMISDQIEKDYLLYYLLSRKFLDPLYRTAKGTKQANLSTAAMHRLKVLCPDLKEQQEIGKIFQVRDLKREIHETKKYRMEELFRTLLHQLMTGQIRVNDLDLDLTGITTRDV